MKIYLSLSKESNDDVRRDLASTFQGHLVEKKYSTTSFFFLNLIILNEDKACRQWGNLLKIKQQFSAKEKFDISFFKLFYFNVLQNNLTKKTLGITCWATESIHNTTHDMFDVKSFQLYVNVSLLLVAVKGS